MTALISLVLFDMDDVLSHYDRSARVHHLSVVSGRTYETVREAIWESGLEASADAGLISDEEYLTAMGEILGCHVTRDDWLVARRASMSPNFEVLALVRKLSARYRVAVLTNNCRLVTENIQYLNPAVAELFGPHVYASASFGAAKPAAHTYLRCLDALGVSAAETLFIDDLEVNAEGAINAGLHGHVFTGAGSLSEELERRKLL
ncbi:HAD family phosphatase [Paraburkholderia sp. SEWSISQ10-3 4]|uniref:HAD family hydrolase n=1 Tax=Paraburkholderia TaxID=1822464 RepID=UPI00190A6088|nr:MULTISPECIES: HAD family phosphatase [Paraburkholderia]MBK3839988.1 HAD family phosphatase [Paraburkholderia aspalathi]MCX4140263.1 HAD family phosphatase [Paraburkholderia aspalathi]MDN7172950.1 HAD family phosphatase [Paraburkholderia sp. SEWSISQ10-3 4]MDQ6502589.1 HAD family phosphatase [Paraburkholderia aspalathi]